MNNYNFLKNVWNGDDILELSFQKNWNVSILEAKHQSSLSETQIKSCISKPIKSKSLDELSEGKRSVAIVVDDLTRPTPVILLLKIVLDVLISAGFSNSNIKIIVAGGSHQTLQKKELSKKLGNNINNEIQIISHSCKTDLVYLGKSQAKTPLYVNRHFIDSDLKIGIGGVYAHRAAGFSGGAKIIVPGVCGLKTIKHLHENFKGKGLYNDLDNNQFRQEIEKIAGIFRLDYIINVVLNRDRKIAKVFAGNFIKAHREAAKNVQSIAEIETLDDADIVISDAYPFDNTLQFSINRGAWPFKYYNKNCSFVFLAACPEGLGGHELFPVTISQWKLFIKRIRKVRISNFFAIFALKKSKTIKKSLILNIKDLPIFVLSSYINNTDLISALPNSRLFNNWKSLITELEVKHKGHEVKVIIHRCAPLHYYSEIQCKKNEK